MPQNLKDMRIDEVSFVDNPANPGARVSLFKRGEWDDGGYPDIAKKEFSTDRRKELAGTGAALPDGSFPIENKSDLSNAIHAIGRAKDPAKAKAHIVSRARSLGASDMLPDGWTKRGVSIGVEFASTGGDLKKGIALRKSDAEMVAAIGNDELSEAFCALAESARSICDDESVADKQAMVSESFAEFKDHVETLTGESLEKVLSRIARISKKDIEMTEDEVKKAVDAAVAKAIADKDAEIAKAAKEIALLKMSDKHAQYMKDAGMDGDAKDKFCAMSADERDAHMGKNPIEKFIPESVKKALADNEAIRKELADMKAERELAAITKRAADLGLAAEFVDVIGKAKKGDAAAVDKLLDTIGSLSKSKTAIERTSKIFAEFGNSQGTGEEMPALDQLYVKRDEILKANPDLTKEQAFTKALAANPDLRKREKEERMAKAGRAA